MSSYSDIGALSVRLNLETGSFNKKISAINKEIKFLETDFKSAGKGIKNFENSFKGLSDKIAKLNKQIGLSNTKLSTQKKQMEEYSKALKKQQNTLADLERTHGKTSTEYKKQATLVGQIASKMRSLETAINTTEGQLRDYNNQLSEAKNKMSVFGKTTETFEQKLKDVRQESKLVSSEFDKLIASFEEGTFKHASAEMDKLKSSLQGVKNEAKLYENEIKQLESAQKTLISTEQSLVSEINKVESELSQAKSKYGETSTQVEKLDSKLAELKQTLLETKTKHSENVSAIRDHKTELNNLETQAINTSRQLSAIPVNTVARKFANAGSTMMNTGAVLSASVGLPMMMVGQSAVTTAMNFEEGMSRVQAVTGESAEVMAKMEAQARELGATTQFSATESAEAMSYLGMAGLKADDIMTAMPATLDIAKAGMLDLGTTADITTNIMSGFGMGAKDLSHIGDVLAHASSNANTNIEQMGEAMVYLAPVGETLGLSLEDVSSAVMTVSNAGIQGARAGAAFSTSLVRLTKPTAAMEKLMEELGISFQTADGQLKPISEIVSHLNGKFEGLTDAQKASAINTLFGAEATKHWSALLNEQEGVLESQTKALENCDGTAKDMAKTMSDNLAGSVKEMKSKLEDMAITIGYSLKPMIEEATETIGKLTDWFADLSPSTQETIVKMGLLAVALPLVTTVVGALFSSLGNLYKGFKLITSGAGKVVGKIGDVGKKSTTVAKGMTKIAPLLTNPWTLLIGAVALGGTAIYTFKKKADKEFQEINEKAKDSITGVGDYINKELPKALESASEKINGIEYFDEGTKGTLMSNVDGLKEALASGKENVNQEVGEIVNTITSNMDEVPEEMRQSISQGLADMISALASDGQLTEQQFKSFIDTLNETAEVKVKVNMEEVTRKNKVSLLFNTFADQMSVVGSTIHTTAGDIQETVNNTVDVLSQAKDEDAETFRLLAQGLAEHVSSLKMSEKEQASILQQMSIALNESFDPEQASVMLQELSTAMGLGLDDIGVLYSQFTSTYNQTSGALKDDTAKFYAEFINSTGNFSYMLAGKFGELSQGNADFWFTFTQQLANSGVEVQEKAQGLVDGFITEMKKSNDPTVVLSLAETMTQYIGQLVSSGLITQEEADKIVSGVNESLGNVEGTVETTIKANIGEFSQSEREILHAMGLIDQETAETDILANISPAMKKLDEYKKENQSVVKKVEETEAEIDMDNSKALTKIKEVNDEDIDDKEATISLKYGSIPTLTLPTLTQNVQVNYPRLIENPETGELSEGIALASDTLIQPFEDLASTMNTVSYSGSMYRSQAPAEPKVTRVENSNDSTMINLLQSMVNEITKLQQNQQTLEAQLYIDGKQLRTHMQTIEKRQNRLSGK